MEFNYKQQMAGVKKALADRAKVLPSVRIHNKMVKIKPEFDKQWGRLNDTYSTLAALALNESITKTGHPKEDSKIRIRKTNV